MARSTPDGFEDLAKKLSRPLHPPGRDLRCIVSVGMLTEGWDCNTVTHVVGLRPFQSQLLCEQVVCSAIRSSGARCDAAFTRSAMTESSRKKSPRCSACPSRSSRSRPRTRRPSPSHRRHPIEPAERLVGLFKRTLHAAQLDRRVGRQGRWDERPDPLPTHARQVEPPQAARWPWFRHLLKHPWITPATAKGNALNL